jgi:IS5 family transposase
MAYHRRVQYNMFDERFQSSLDPTHELILLADKIDWDEITESLLPYYSRTGRRAKPIRLMAGLLILKHRFNLSDEHVVSQLHENLYWMYFCGLSWSPEDGPPDFVESSSLTKFRRRIGAEGMCRVEAVIREQLIRAKVISPRTQLIDTTAMEKDIAYPTDSGLLHRGIGKLVKVIRTVQRYGVASGKKIRSFKRVSKRALVDIHKLGKGRKERIKDNTLKLAGYAREVVKVVPQILEACEEHLRDKATAIGGMTKNEADKARRAIKRLADTIGEQTDVLKRVIHQSEERFKGHHVKNKIYSLHEPQVACIRKGKRAKPDEYGSKVLLSFDRNGYVVAHQEYPSNPSDAGLIEDALDDWQEACERAPHEVGADRGFHRPSYEGEHLEKVERWSVPWKGKKPHPDAQSFWFKRVQSRRAATEPIIGHLKMDHRMDRCRYKGFEGDTINVCLASVAWNLKKWSKSLVPI